MIEEQISSIIDDFIDVKDPIKSVNRDRKKAVITIITTNNK